jgi:hypothetical protein
MTRLGTSLRNALFALAAAVALPTPALAGTQIEEYLAPSVVAGPLVFNRMAPRVAEEL